MTPTDGTAATEESMPGLPEGWSTGSLTTLCALIRGVSYEKGEAVTSPLDGYVALLRANNIGNGLNFNDLQYVPPQRVRAEQMLRPGDVVIAMSSGSKAVVGKAAALTCEWNGTFGAFCGVLRPHGAVTAPYIGLFLQTRQYRDAISEMAAGVNINNLKREYFERIQVPLPPLSEQKRIVAKVEELLAQVNAARDRLERVPAILKRFRASVLSAACSGRLTEDWREGHHDGAWVTRLTPEQPDPDDLPANWTRRPLEAVIGVPLANGHSVPDQKGGFPVLRLTAIRGGAINLAECKEGAWSEREASRFLVQDGDFLVARGNGSLALVGRGGLVRRPSTAVAFPDTMIRIRAGAGLVPEYLSAAWESHVVRAQIEDAAHTTAGIHKVSQKDLSRIILPLPPLEEQREIVRRVHALFALAVAADEKLKAATLRAERLTQSILARAFRGELVPTDAELGRPAPDGPAEDT